jgi:hypothetical protein
MEREMSKQVMISQEQFDALKQVLRQTNTLVGNVISERPNNFRDALDLAKGLSLLKKVHGISGDP